jgi:hypothetical protein
MAARRRASAGPSKRASTMRIMDTDSSSGGLRSSAGASVALPPETTTSPSAGQGGVHAPTPRPAPESTPRPAPESTPRPAPESAPTPASTPFAPSGASRAAQIASSIHWGEIVSPFFLKLQAVRPRKMRFGDGSPGSRRSPVASHAPSTEFHREDPRSRTAEACPGDRNRQPVHPSAASRASAWPLRSAPLRSPPRGSAGLSSTPGRGAPTQASTVGTSPRVWARAGPASVSP